MSRTLLVRLAPHNDGLVFALPERARWVAQVNAALASSETWGEFRARIPAEEYSRIIREVFEDDGEDCPTAEAPFTPEALPGWSDGDYPPWLQSEMDQLLPQTILSVYGIQQHTPLNGSYWHLPESSLGLISDALRAEGWTVIRADDLEFW